MAQYHYMIFGDIHGRILPAFRLATVWAREHDVVIDGLLQVGDVGFFPDRGRMDRATQQHAKKDPLEHGAELVVELNDLADAIFSEAEIADTLWHTLGNHEDFELIESLATNGSGNDTDFPLDAYARVRCIRNGKVAELPSGVKVGALWGISGRGRSAKRLPPSGIIKHRAAAQLAGSEMDVLLTHDSFRHGVYQNSGSEEIDLVLDLARPAFSFFGHYHDVGRQCSGRFSQTEVYHLEGFELRGRNGCAEENSVGILRWGEDGGSFKYLDPKWLKTFTRHNWEHR